MLIIIPIIYFMNIQHTNFSAVGPLCSMLKTMQEILLLCSSTVGS
jgi:hypothetical protein